MAKNKINLKKDILNDLYWNKNLSPYKIGYIFGCSFATVTNRFKEFGIPFKNHSMARQKYPKQNFSGDLCEKAYLLGFRIGDLNVYKTSEGSNYTVVRCHTTSADQSNLITSLFERYGKVTISQSGQINCHLNDSFDFLLEKYGKFKEIRSKKEFFSFVAGYLDAEGYFGINQGKARLKVDSYDSQVLMWMSENLKRFGIRNKLKVIGVCKTKRSFGKELWRINVNWADDLLHLIFCLRPYAKHKKRIHQMKTCENNIVGRTNDRKN